MNPFTLKQIRGFDFDRRVKQVKYLPNYRKHILYIEWEGIMVLDHLTGRYNFFGQSIFCKLMLFQEMPNRFTNYTKMWIICCSEGNLVEYILKDTKVDSKKSSETNANESELI